MPKPPPLTPDELPDWPEGDPSKPLAESVVRVWVWSLEGDASRARSLLSRDEIERADRFYFEPDRRHFTNARAGLRELLGAAIRVEPAALRFAYDGLGKPKLPAELASDIRFNLSHSAGIAMVAMTRGNEIGVDLEAVRPSNWSSGIAERYFSSLECDKLRAQPPGEQDAAFFRFWTNKEAVVKLLGAGLGFPLQSFVTPLDAASGASVLLLADNPLRLSQCWLQSLPAGDRLKASVCCAAPPAKVELFRTPNA